MGSVAVSGNFIEEYALLYITQEYGDAALLDDDDRDNLQFFTEKIREHFGLNEHSSNEQLIVKVCESWCDEQDEKKCEFNGKSVQAICDISGVANAGEDQKPVVNVVNFICEKNC